MFRVIKLALISFVFLFLIVTAISLFIPSHIRLSKAVNIGDHKKQVMALIGDTSQWGKWHPLFIHYDSLMQPPPVTITPMVQNDSVIMVRMQFGTQKPVVNGWQFYNYSSTDSLTLQWYMDFHLNWYPWQKFGSMMYENTYGVMMEQGLNNIKKLVEHTP